ncbi:MAG: glycosyltransferase family 4 protein [bacterium]|nr:glycosyltransferase family 4 protein [bacterium]
MKVLYHHRTQAEDGQAVHIRSLIEALRAEGHTVREVALVTAAPEEGGAPAARMNGSATETRDARWSWIGSVPRFARELAEYAYTVPAKRKITRAAAELDPDFLYERYAFGCAGGVQASERLRKPLVLEVNSPMVLELSKTRGLSFPRFARRLETSIFRRATRVCVVTGVLRDMLVEMGVPRESIFVTPNGVHPEHFEGDDREAARADLGVAAAVGPVLGFVGYYRDWHRLDLVVEALTDPALETAHLVLVGAGPAETELRECAQRLGVAARVHFPGTRPHARIPALLSAFDLALVPAINPYASPLKLHEYMAAGLATIAPDQANLREVLTDGANALLVPPGDADAMCHALVRLVEDPALRTRLGEAARSSIHTEDLTWRGNARRVVEAIEPFVGVSK